MADSKGYVVPCDIGDWMTPPDGQLDITVADVMGKGVAAALIMATLRATLRAVPLALGPLERARALSESLAAGITDDGMFVTLFNCRLDAATGELRYVDLGHGHFAVQRADLPDRTGSDGATQAGEPRIGFLDPARGCA